MARAPVHWRGPDPSAAPPPSAPPALLRRISGPETRTLSVPPHLPERPPESSLTRTPFSYNGRMPPDCTDEFAPPRKVRMKGDHCSFATTTDPQSHVSWLVHNHIREKIVSILPRNILFTSFTCLCNYSFLPSFFEMLEVWTCSVAG